MTPFRILPRSRKIHTEHRRMNWMTSGRHRALYSQRGRRRQMHFPSQVQRQRVKHTSPPRSSHVAKAQDVTPWYIKPIGDDDESQDIRVLELEREGARKTIEAGTEVKQADCGDGEAAQSSLSHKRSHEQQEKEVRDGRSKRRCIFTPVKKARKYDQPLPVLQRVGKERPPSSIASGIDMLFFNDGKELQGKNQRQHAAISVADSSPSGKHHSRILKFKNAVQETLQRQQPNYQDEDLRSHSRKSESQKQSSDGETTSMRDYQSFLCGKEYEPDRRDFHLWKVNSSSCHGSIPDSTFARSDTASIRSTRIDSHQGSPPSSPLEVSPLPFRMSRADVLQSQLSARVSHAASDPLESRLNFTPTPQSSQSPSTSASSQGSMVLGRPPLGWQKKMLLSLKGDTGDKEENSLPESVGLPFADDFAGSKLYIAAAPTPHNSLEDPLEQPSSPNSSRDSSESTIDAVVPIDAKERIMTAVSSQHIAEDSRAWFQRGVMAKIENTSGKDVALSGKSMALQQSWVMSSRTQEILDAVSSKALYTETTTENHSTKLQEMESVAVYMYTLVQCYKVDEKLRADTCIRPVVDVLPPPPIAETSTQQIASRRAIAFSPKNAN